VAAVAAGLERLGVGAGDRVGYMMNNHPEVVATYFAILRLGAVAVAVNVMLRPAELVYLVEDSGTGVLVCESSVADIAVAARARRPRCARSWCAAVVPEARCRSRRSRTPAAGGRRRPAPDESRCSCTRRGRRLPRAS
jgi:acyl-CoA synthetase (AMP-forming)/AMP-acid ligase II